MVKNDMVEWNDFCRVGRVEAMRLGWKDPELFQLFESPVLPPKNTNEIGRPMPGTISISKHPDTDNYRRVMIIRREIALENELPHYDYVRYADETLKFLDNCGPFSEQINCMWEWLLLRRLNMNFSMQRIPKKCALKELII